MIEEKEIKFLEREEEGVKLSEVYPNNHVTEYCFLDENDIAIHPQVRCKDYIQDLFWVSKLIDCSKSTSDKNIHRLVQSLEDEDIYGFNPYKYCIKYPFINRDSYKVGIRFRTEGQNFRQYTIQYAGFAQSLLKFIETSFEFPYSKVSLSTSKEILIFEFSSSWTKTPYLLSLYLLLIRLLSKSSEEEMKSIKDFKKWLLEYPGKNSGNDAQNLHGAEFLLNTIFKENIFPEQKWEDYKSLRSIHNNSGISSFSKFLKILENQSKKEPAMVTIENEEESEEWLHHFRDSF